MPTSERLKQWKALTKEIVNDAPTMIHFLQGYLDMMGYLIKKEEEK